MATLTQILLELETRLMDPEVRRNGTAAEMIADDFMEFGGNGRIFNKNDALAMMRHHAPAYSPWKSSTFVNWRPG